MWVNTGSAKNLAKVTSPRFVKEPALKILKLS